MGWPLWFVLGLVILAACITFAYMIWLQEIAGYVEVGLADTHSENAGVIVTVRRRSPPHAHDPRALEERDDVPVAVIVASQSKEPTPPWVLDEKMAAKMETSPVVQSTRGSAEDVVSRVTVVKEPGYNAFIVYHKHIAWLMHASRAWRNSFFHAAMMPVEILLRWSSFPILTMMDMVSHDRRVAACLVVKSGQDATECKRIEEEVKKRVSIIETYDSVYAHVDNSGEYVFEVHSPDGGNCPQYSVL